MSANDTDRVFSLLREVCTMNGIQTEGASAEELILRLSKQLIILKADLLRARGKDPSGRWA